LITDSDAIGVNVVEVVPALVRVNVILLDNTSFAVMEPVPLTVPERLKTESSSRFAATL
jgi:hypothetical protein